jgi:hypothetical protein
VEQRQDVAMAAVEFLQLGMPFAPITTAKVPTYLVHNSRFKLHTRRLSMATNKQRKDSQTNDVRDRDANEDPITGEHGAHPVGAGLGAAAGGAAAGAAAGAVAGPVGAAVGIVAGGIAGGLVGKEVAERIDPTTEEQYWREEYPKREYYDPAIGYEEVGPAYRYGWESRVKHHDRGWDEAEPELEREWARGRGDSSLGWQQARPATRDAWERVDLIVISEVDENSQNDTDKQRRDESKPRTPK